MHHTAPHASLVQLSLTCLAVVLLGIVARVQANDDFVWEEEVCLSTFKRNHEPDGKGKWGCSTRFDPNHVPYLAKIKDQLLEPKECAAVAFYSYIEARMIDGEDSAYDDDSWTIDKSLTKGDGIWAKWTKVNGYGPLCDEPLDSTALRGISEAYFQHRNAADEYSVYVVMRDIVDRGKDGHYAKARNVTVIYDDETWPLPEEYKKFVHEIGRFWRAGSGDTQVIDPYIGYGENVWLMQAQDLWNGLQVKKQP